MEVIMHKLIAAAALTLVLVGPALAQNINRVPGGDNEIQTDLQWQQLVQQANEHRVATKEVNVVERNASVSPASATDAAISQIKVRHTMSEIDAAANAPHRPYTRIEDYWQDK
jgi:hypothetical protein